MRILHEDCMVILNEVIDLPLTDSAFAAYCWVQGKTQRDEPVSIDLLMERFQWTILDAMRVQTELIENGLLADTRNNEWER